MQLLVNFPANLPYTNRQTSILTLFNKGVINHLGDFENQKRENQLALKCNYVDGQDPVCLDAVSLDTVCLDPGLGA